MTSDDQLVGLLRARRLALGLIQRDVERRVGWPDFYCAKLEAPHRRYGRRVAGLFTAALFDWLEGLGLALVVMDIAEAETLGASPDAPMGAAGARGNSGCGQRTPMLTHTLLTRITVVG